MAKYKNHYRSNDNFIESNCVAMDIDNDHSEDPKDWVDIKDVKRSFPNIKFAVVYSRNHQKRKDGKSPRPRMHIYFPIENIASLKEYVALKESLIEYFTFFDKGAKDGARFFFGIESPIVEIVKGRKYVTDMLLDDFEEWDKNQGLISQGSRNNTMSLYAGRVLIRYGESKEARDLFDKKAGLCSPPLEEEEIESIWQSALKFQRKVAKTEGYIPPEEYKGEFSLKPSEYSDLAQAMVYAEEYGHKVRYSPSTKFLVYNGSYWEESDLKAQGLSQDLVNRQIEEASGAMLKAKEEMKKNGALALIEGLGVKKAESNFSKIQKQSYLKYLSAETYKKYAVKRGDTRYINATTKEVMPMVEISLNILDQDEFLLNTPSKTIDLRTGKSQDHDTNNYITKQTTVDESDKGMDLWLESLNVFFLKDKELIDYVQKVVGLAAIGKVYLEALIIAYGDGKNGKSTFWNVIAKVLGSYSGVMSADILTVGSKRNVRPEMAEAKGKRLLIAAELEEGMRLSTSNIKQLCSTDDISAEKKYKDPFKFTPTHTLVLYTNHLPKVGAIDDGTWRRLIVIPFLAKIKGSSDVKNYGDYLFENAGEAILKWIIQGAKKAIEEGYKFTLPDKVKDAIEKYRQSSDWFGLFLSECCEVDSSYEEKSGELYQEYRAFCFRTGEYARSTTDFYSALSSEGFERKKRRDGVRVIGLKLKSEFV